MDPNSTTNTTTTTTTTPLPVTTTNFTITIINPPPPFPAPPRSIDLSPLKFILGVIAVIAVPALLYALFFTIPCSSSFRRRRYSSDAIASTTEESLPPPTSATTATASDGGASAPASGIKFQKETHSKEIGNECTVCLSVFADGEEIRQLSACKHAFHTTCIDMWLSSHASCPICRASVPVKRPNGNNNSNNSTGNNNRRVSAHNRDDDLHQGLPDASALI